MRMRALKYAARTAILAAAAAGVCALPAAAQAVGLPAAGIHQAAAPIAATTTAGVAASAPNAPHDLPDTAVADDYPWRQYAATYLNGDTYTARQCSAFALWRIDNRLRKPVNTTLIKLASVYTLTGAKDLDEAAVRAGYKVDNTPAVGSLATWEAGAGGAGKYGHVAFVARVYADRTILIEEYNGLHPLAYSTRRIAAGGVSHFLHLARR